MFFWYRIIWYVDIWNCEATFFGLASSINYVHFLTGSAIKRSLLLSQEYISTITPYHLSHTILVSRCTKLQMVWCWYDYFIDLFDVYGERDSDKYPSWADIAHFLSFLFAFIILFFNFRMMYYMHRSMRYILLFDIVCLFRTSHDVHKAVPASSGMPRSCPRALFDYLPQFTMSIRPQLKWIFCFRLKLGTCAKNMKPLGVLCGILLMNLSSLPAKSAHHRVFIFKLF